MVSDITNDARGILAPDVGLKRFNLERCEPSGVVGRLVDRYWVVRWELPAGEGFDQHVWPHPVTNVVFENGAATAGGVTTRLFTRRLEGRGRAVGVMFRPGGFRPLVARRMRTLTDRTIAFDDLIGPRATALARAVENAADDQVAVGLIDALLTELVPSARHPAETTVRLAETAATDRRIVRVEQLAQLARVSARTLQRRFADHVGISPKAVIRRYRLFDAAEAARHDEIDWAGLAVTLGYADQAHLIRDFRTAIGMTPASYARACRPSG
ncbi:MAG: DUF6597 domain-containing transcriptional factor [Egibacteraceae bacterium]